MFTGIVQKTAPILGFSERNRIHAVRVAKPADWELKEGQSIAIDGICSTVASCSPDYFDVQYMPETLKKTTARSFGPNVLVNLERSLTLSDFVDGHVTQGHVDAVVKVSSIKEDGDSRLVTIAIPKKLQKFVVELGSIALNGVSLTVARKKAGKATVALIPHTIANTNLGALKKGDKVNVEVDVMARYVAALLKK